MDKTYPSKAQKPFRISRERKELLSLYAESAVFLYGMLSIEEFVEVFNNYEPDCKTTEQEAELALMRLAKTDDVEYSLKDSLLSGPAFQPDFDEYEYDVEYYRAAQKGKPRYIPRKDELLRYQEGSYREPEKPWTDIKAYILKHKLTDRGEGLDGVDGDLMDLHEFIQENVLSAGQEIEFFTDIGYKFKDINDANGNDNGGDVGDDNGGIGTINVILEDFTMKLALTKKLATAMGVKVAPADENTDPLFSWTANWTNTFDGRKEDMIVMVNNATRFTVAIYGVKWNQFKSIAAKITSAIRNTLAAMNLNHEIIDEYMLRAGEIEFVSNNDRKKTAWVNRQGLDAAFYIGRTVNESEGRIKFDDTIGHFVSKNLVNYSNSSDEGYYPAEKMIKALVELTGKPAYRYRAFELLVTLDLEIYKATRRLIVAADIEFSNLHKALQSVFDWKNYHLHDFKVLDVKSKKPVRRLVMSDEDQFYDKEAVLETGLKLSDYFPKYRQIIYTYDFGDNWSHLIEFVWAIEDHDKETPYLLEAKGQTPPEDVGGIPGFIEFREAMLDESHPNHSATKAWVRYWSPELSEWKAKPRVIHY